MTDTAATPTLDLVDTKPLRGLLRTRLNIPSQREYIVELHGMLLPMVGCWLRYIPDRFVLEPASILAYRGAISGLVGDTEQSFLAPYALAILDDINNELVPLWVQVVLTSGIPGHVPHHRVAVDDRQPNWDNPGLLGRLPLF